MKVLVLLTGLLLISCGQQSKCYNKEIEIVTYYNCRFPGYCTALLSNGKEKVIFRPVIGQKFNSVKCD